MRVTRFHSGQSLRDLRPQLNALVESANKDLSPRGSVGRSDVLPTPILWLEIRAFIGTSGQTLQCSLPDQQFNPSAETWDVSPPTTLTPLTRDGITYVYVDVNNRTADGTEVQELTPRYLVGDLLAVADLEEGDNRRDLNIDGRQWAKVP